MANDTTQRSPHPTIEDFEAYFADAMSSERSDDLERHFASCVMCREIAARMGDSLVELENWAAAYRKEPVETLVAPLPAMAGLKQVLSGIAPQLVKAALQIAIDGVRETAEILAHPLLAPSTQMQLGLVGESLRSATGEAISQPIRKALLITQDIPGIRITVDAIRRVVTISFPRENGDSYDILLLPDKSELTIRSAVGGSSNESVAFTELADASWDVLIIQREHRPLI